MVLSSTLIAVALGLTPVQDGQVIRQPAASAREIGRYAEVTDAHGVRHLRGFDRHGRHYDITVATNGKVEANVGDQVIEFTVVEAN